jgi:hypothetical protein
MKWMTDHQTRDKNHRITISLLVYSLTQAYIYLAIRTCVCVISRVSSLVA